MTRTLSRPELIAWTRLARTPRIGPLTFHRLMARFKTAAAALEALPRVSNLAAPPEAGAHTEIEGVEALGGRLARLLEAPAGAVAAAVTELEMDGRAASLPGGYAASSGAAFSN